MTSLLFSRKRFLVRFTTLALVLSVAHGASAFNPRGRERKPPKPSRTTQPKPKAPAARPSAPEPSESGPSAQALIQRYTKIVLEQPGSPFPLQRLATLYRERDGNLDKLIAEFEALANQSGASRYNALVALAGIYAQANQYDRAVAGYEQAIGLEPKNAIALLALGRLHEERGDKQRAKALFERALPELKVAADIEQTLRLLLALHLDTKDFEKARAVHQQLVRRAKGSFFVRAELGRELMLRHQYEEAVREFRELVKAAQGDNRALAPALRDLGRALTRQGNHEEALEVLKRALTITGSESGVRREVLETMVEVYRQREQLDELIALLQKERGNDFQRTRLLAGLYEETGRIDDAIATYRKALALNKNDIDVRLKLVQLLQIQGELDAAISEHKALVRAAPHNPDFVLQLAEALLQQGDKQGALSQLLSLERRSGSDEQTLALLVDFYERMGESDRAMALLQRLAEHSGGNPEHVIELGNRHYEEGETEKAQATWKRVLVLLPDRAQALHSLGEVYLEHDMAELALASLEEAVNLEPSERRYRKALAIALERTGSGASKKVRRERHERARKIWEQLLAEAGTNHRYAQEARQHIVTLWSLSGTLNSRLKPLERNLNAKPPDLNAGRLLAEMHLRLRRYEEAERVLAKVTEHAPGDVASYLRLERVLVLQQKLPQAILVLKKLVEAEPKRAREYYQRMSQYAAEAYRDDEAIEYAAKAVALSPDDAMGHKNLAEMYRKRQDPERAIAEYRQAISKNDRLFPVYFDLAEMLFSRQEHDEADRLLRRVMRAAVDEELIARATRLSMQINLGKQSLESLEQELLPIALGNPQRPVYRRLLVEIYGALAFPLVQKARSSDPETREGAKARLRRIGQRAVKPLLDALSDPRDAQQRVAIELLTVLENKSASAALFAYASGEAEPDLRVRAMIASGAPADEGMLERFERLLVQDGQIRVDEGDPVSIAAAWGVARLKSAGANRFKLKLLEAEAPSARALAALSLGLAGVRAAEAPLRNMLKSEEQGPVARAAVAYALSELGVKGEEKTLMAMTQSVDDRVKAAALTTLARNRVHDVQPRLAEAIVFGSDTLRSAAIGASVVLATGAYDRPDDPLGTPSARVELDPILAAFAARAEQPSEKAAALELLSEELAAACRSAVQSSPERARAVADALLARGGQPAFGELTAQLDRVDAATRTRAEAAAENILSSVIDPFIALARHPLPDLRAVAIELLSTRDEVRARQALVEALDDRDVKVRRAVLAALERYPDLSTLDGVVKLLSADEPWATRLAAAETLAAYGSLKANSPAFTNAVQRLAERALHDDYSLVRQAAARSLWALSPGSGRQVLSELAERDPEPRVRETAKALLSGK